MREELAQLFTAVGRPSLAALKENAEVEGYDVSRSTLWHLLNGKGRPRLSTVEAFVAACVRIARTHRPQIRLPDLLIDPGRWRALHLAAETSTVEANPPPIVVPRQLPPAARLVGRDAELHELDRRVDGGIVVVTGTAGVGKTTLAVSWARRVAERFPDGQLYVDLHGFQPVGDPVRPEDVLRGFLEALDVPTAKIPADLAARSALYRSLMDGRRILVVLDNAYDLAQVRPLLPGSPGCLALVASRRHFADLVALLGARRLTVDVFGVDSARHLLAERLGTARVAAEPAAVDRIIAACAGLPLALAIVAASATRPPERPLAAIAGDLRPALDGLRMGDDPAADVRAVLSWSYRALPADAARLFRLLGLHPGPDVARDAIASLAGLTADQLAAPLAELVGMHLLAAVGDRYGLHDLLREYAYELAQTDDETPAVGRLVTHYLRTAEAAVGAVDPPRDDHIRLVPAAEQPPMADADEALTWFRIERRTLVSMVELAFREGMDEHAWQLARTVSTLLDRQLHWEDWRSTATVGLRAAERLGHPSAQAAAHRSLAHVAVQQARFTDAGDHLSAALALFEVAGDAASQAATHNSLGGLCEQSGRYEDALAHSREAQRLFELAGDQIGRAHALNSIGWCEARLGRYPEALEWCLRSQERLHELGDRFGEAVAWDSTGFIRHTMGDKDEAIGCFERARELFRAVGEQFYESVTLDHFGDCQRDRGHRDAAVSAWRQALDLVRDVDPDMADALRTKIADSITRR